MSHSISSESLFMASQEKMPTVTFGSKVAKEQCSAEDVALSFYQSEITV